MIMQVINIPIVKLEVSKFNVRKTLDTPQFEDDSSVTDLASDINMNGLINPITVRKFGEKYEIIAGQRRYMAMKYLQYESIPCNVVKVSDTKAKEISLVENMSRNSMTAKDKVKAFCSLFEIYKSVDKIESCVGLTKNTIRKYLAMGNLQDHVLEMIDGDPKNKITIDVALQLAKIGDEDVIDDVLREMKSVKNTEKMEILKKFNDIGKNDIQSLRLLMNPKKIVEEKTTISISIPNSLKRKMLTLLIKNFGDNIVMEE